MAGCTRDVIPLRVLGDGRPGFGDKDCSARKQGREKSAGGKPADKGKRRIFNQG